MRKNVELSFKPYYNWNGFNTLVNTECQQNTGSFKPYYNWNAFNTLDFDKSTDFMVS